MKKKRILKELRRARASGCSCLTWEPREVCAACFASDLLGETAPHRRHQFAEKVARLVSRDHRDEILA